MKMYIRWWNWRKSIRKTYPKFPINFWCAATAVERKLLKRKRREMSKIKTKTRIVARIRTRTKTKEIRDTSKSIEANNHLTERAPLTSFCFLSALDGLSVVYLCLVVDVPSRDVAFSWVSIKISFCFCCNCSIVEISHAITIPESFSQCNATALETSTKAYHQIIGFGSECR